MQDWRWDSCRSRSCPGGPRPDDRGRSRHPGGWRRGPRGRLPWDRNAGGDRRRPNPRTAHRAGSSGGPWGSSNRGPRKRTGGSRPSPDRSAARTGCPPAGPSSRRAGVIPCHHSPGGAGPSSPTEREYPDREPPRSRPARTPGRTRRSPRSQRARHRPGRIEPAGIQTPGRTVQSRGSRPSRRHQNRYPPPRPRRRRRSAPPRALT